jgi:radical SAM protein (TIGR01212 family)
MTCPNRDGTLDTRGCIFCSAGGSGEFAESACASVTAQIDRAKGQVAGKYKGDQFIAYFQNFTNTYAPVDRLEALFTEALAHPNVVALSVGTRPDCLPPETVALLSRLNQRKPVWVELGLQTIHPETAAYIRRGYALPVYDRAVQALTAEGIHVVTHVILHLPGETRQQMLETVDYVCRSGAGGIKLHLLQVLQGTDLEADWRAGNVPLPDLEEYAELIGECLARLPENMVVHRITGDGPKSLLLAPLWCGDKKRVMNRLRREVEKYQTPLDKS